MSRFGRYEVVEELYRTAMATVSRARLAGGAEPRYAVKAFAPPLFGEVDREHEAAEAGFLERAALQRKLAAERVNRHWAPLHDVGKQDDRAYYVCDYYPLTAQKLITGRVAMTPATLHRLVNSVVRGLRELRVAADRAHGNLKPSNVLIAGQGDATAAARVLLTDPTPASRLGDAGEHSDDLVSLGNLIHQLVLHRPFRSPGGWPLQPSPEWDNLGRARGGRWRDLCNRLLDPTGQQRPADLGEVAKLVARLGSNRTRRIKQLLGTLLAAALLLGGAGAFVYHLDGRERASVVAANSGWIGELHRRQLDAPRTLDAFRADPTLAGLIDADAAARERGVRTDIPQRLPHDTSAVEAFRKARAAAALVADLSGRIVPEKWPLLKVATERVAKYRERGWEQPATELGRITEGVTESRDATFWKHAADLLTVSPHLAADSEAERGWAALERATRAASGEASRPAQSVMEALRRRARAAAALTPAGIAGADQFAACAAAADAWSALAGTEHDDVALERLIEAEKLDVRTADPPTLRAFAMRVAPQVRLTKLDAAPDMPTRLQSFDRTCAFADKDDKSAGERKAYEDAKTAVSSTIARLRTRGGTQAELDALREAIDAFGKKWSVPTDPTSWLRVALAEPRVTSPAVRRAWTRWVDAAALSRANTDADIPIGVRKETERFKEALQALDQRFAAATATAAAAAPLPAAYAQAAAEKREEVLASILPNGARPGTALPPAMADPRAAAKPYEEWLANLAALSKDFPVREPLLDDPLPRPDEAWAKSNPTFWQDDRVQALVRPDVRRLRELSAVRAMTDRGELTTLASDEGLHAELALAAWRRLSALDPPWPANAAELQTEAKLRTTLLKAFASVPPAERAAVERELAAQGPGRWYRLVNHLGPSDAADLDRAAALAETFTVPLDVSNGTLPANAPLTASARFNLLLRAARAAAAKAADDTQATRLAQSLSTLVPAETKEQLVTFLADLSKLDRKPWYPAALKIAGDGRATLAVPGVSADLEFVRVRADGVAPFYLCRTEVSLAVFLAVVGDQPGGLLPKVPPPGPRVWQRQADGTVTVPTLGYWLEGPTVENRAGFADSLREGRNRFLLAAAAGGPPTAEHPMQKVTPAVALYVAGALGCRLPSPAEWVAAAATAKDVKDWNLRDATWKLQRDFVAARPAAETAPWPDAGIFVPADQPVARGAQAKAMDSNDAALFFRPVGPEKGRVFSNLVGNVAEFVFDAPETFEDLADKKAASVVAFLGQHKKDLSVVGGSALSPPEVPVDKPIPVADVNAAYADVGFRLAFSEPAGSPLARLRAVLAAQPYLPPKQ